MLGELCPHGGGEIPELVGLHLGEAKKASEPPENVWIGGQFLWSEKNECLEDDVFKSLVLMEVGFFCEPEERKIHPQHLDSVPNMAESLLILLYKNT